MDRHLVNKKIHEGPRGGKYYIRNGNKYYVTKSTSWSKKAPKKVGKRRELAKHCPQCFLLPEKRKFPVCSKCGRKICTCVPNCRGLISAKIRANQWKFKHPEYKKVAEKADQLINKYKCTYKSKGLKGKPKRK